ncbi:MAG: M15 family metallopeptidase [Oscillospiraceae bacterium]|nr:M15 family metallopeptidase [Oscillospiraceae bacterium]
MLELKSKQKILLPYIAAVLSIAIVALSVQIAALMSEAQHSRVRSLELFESFTEQIVELSEDKQKQFDLLVSQIAESSVPALEKKAEKMKDLQLLTLVNPWNNIPEGYVPELEEITENQSVDVRCADDLRKMVLDCFMDGGSPYICSSYRTTEMQEYLFENKIARLRGEGYSAETAPEVAAKSVAVPGTSEHQLGLAVDIIDRYFTDLTYMQEYTYTQQWLIANSWKYGFILRYPNGTTDITGIIYEPWHYRYVGREAAAEIYESGLTFEEYLPSRRGR